MKLLHRVVLLEFCNSSLYWSAVRHATHYPTVCSCFSEQNLRAKSNNFPRTSASSKGTDFVAAVSVTSPLMRRRRERAAWGSIQRTRCCLPSGALDDLARSRCPLYSYWPLIGSGIRLLHVLYCWRLLRLRDPRRCLQRRVCLCVHALKLKFCVSFVVRLLAHSQLNSQCCANERALAAGGSRRRFALTYCSCFCWFTRASYEFIIAHSCRPHSFRSSQSLELFGDGDRDRWYLYSRVECAVLYCTVLYCTVLYCTVLYTNTYRVCKVQ